MKQFLHVLEECDLILEINSGDVRYKGREYNNNALAIW